jgi:hypothetical protein
LEHQPASPGPPYGFNPVINSGSVYEYTFSPYLGYAAVDAYNSNMNAYWDALEIDVRHPVTQGLFLTVAYTWSHGLAQGSTTNIFGGGLGVQNAYNPGADYGNSLVDVPQVLSVSSIWNLPWDRNAQGWKGAVLGGWKYSDLTTIQSGFSMTPSLSVSKQGLATRPNSTGAAISGPRTVNEWFNKGAFAAPAAGYFGNAGVGSILGPGLVDFDMAFYKDFRIRERHTIEFRAEIFNIFNRANFSVVQTTFGASNFGQVTGARDPRIAEFVLRYQF